MMRTALKGMGNWNPSRFVIFLLVPFLALGALINDYPFVFGK